MIPVVTAMIKPRPSVTGEVPLGLALLTLGACATHAPPRFAVSALPRVYEGRYLWAEAATECGYQVALTIDTATPGADGAIADSTPVTSTPFHFQVGTAYVFEEIADAVACPATPSVGCAQAGKGQILFKYNYGTDNTPVGQLKWKFSQGPELHRADFGDPVTATNSFSERGASSNASRTWVVLSMTPTPRTLDPIPQD